MSSSARKGHGPVSQMPISSPRPTTAYNLKSNHPPITFSPCVVSNSNTSLITYHSRSNTHVRDCLDAGSRTPVSSPRKGAGTGVKTRPVTVPTSRKVVEVQGVACQDRLTRSKTSRRVKTQDSGDQEVGSRPRPRTRTLSVVLPPRKISSVSSTCVIDDDEACRVVKESPDECEPGFVGPQQGPVKIRKLHYSSRYTPHKAHWVKKALENLGTDWVRKGKLTEKLLVSPEFEEKMAVLYDLSMSKKFEAIDTLPDEEAKEIVEGRGRNKKKSGLVKKVEALVDVEVQKNFPFSMHISEGVKRKMSDSLLCIMMRDDEAALNSNKNKDRGDGHATSTKKNIDQDATNNSTSSNSFEKSLKKKKRSLVQCYVIDGKLVVGTKDKMLSVGGSFVNKFGETLDSRARRHPTEDRNYFRQTANMMGFNPHEVNIRYCKNSRHLIVSGARPKRGSENARQVRETLEVPKTVDIYSGLAVLRTCKGSLIFEEVEVVVEEDHGKEEKKKVVQQQQWKKVEGLKKGSKKVEL